MLVFVVLHNSPSQFFMTCLKLPLSISTQLILIWLTSFMHQTPAVSFYTHWHTLVICPSVTAVSQFMKHEIIRSKKVNAPSALELSFFVNVALSSLKEETPGMTLLLLRSFVNTGRGLIEGLCKNQTEDIYYCRLHRTYKVYIPD